MPRYCSRISCLVGEMLVRRIAPQRRCGHAGAAARRSLGEAVGQRLQQDVRIIVVLGLEAREMRLDAVDADREAADPVLAVGIDEVGEAHVGAALALLHLLAQERQAHLRRCRRATSTSSPSRRQRHRPTTPLRGQPLLGDDLVEHRLGIGEQAARAFADDSIVEDRGIIAGQLPGAEEGRPVDSTRAGRAAAIRRSCAGPAARGGGAFPLRIGREARWRAPRRASRSSLWPLPARASRTRCIIGGGLVDEARRAACRDTSAEATPTARLASSTWITGPS